MEDELCKSADKVFKIKYHFVFCIKYRKDLFLEGKYVQTIKEVCERISKKYYVKFGTQRNPSFLSGEFLWHHKTKTNLCLRDSKSLIHSTLAS